MLRYPLRLMVGGMILFRPRIVPRSMPAFTVYSDMFVSTYSTVGILVSINRHPYRRLPIAAALVDRSLHRLVRHLPTLSASCFDDLHILKIKLLYSPPTQSK